jgi:HAD superfamily hydrolase (TIGR01509 family)
MDPARVTTTRQNNNRRFDLVIFDCDGVLVDSELISCRAHSQTLTRHGYAISEQQVLERFLGVSDREARLTIEAEIGRKLPDDFEAEVKQATLQFYAGDLRAISNVGEAIAAIELPKCVASSGTPEKIKHGLLCADLYDVLAPNIFSATQVTRGKPAPDLFLFAAEQMRASPARCVVIEDSVPGITGALAAGMSVLGFHGGSHCRPGHADKLRAAGAHRTFDDMRQLPALIAAEAVGASQDQRRAGILPKRL